jgi:hypothetical protein
MNKRTQILKQITSDKIPRLIENPVALIKSITPESNSIPLPNEQAGLLEEQIVAIAERLKIKACYLHAWLSQFSQAPLVNQISLLRFIEQYGLDPFLEEVDLVQYEDQSWQAVITTQGYARLVNACPQFKGIIYSYSEPDSSAISAWIECAIYRSDREGPIIVREYYLEARRDSIAWQKMPRRMLRNRAFQQCAKMALGI